MQDDSLVYRAIETCKVSKVCFCKFVSANDSGETGAHQAGFYIPKNSIKLIFDNEHKKGSNDDRLIKIQWQGEKGFETESRFVYYGSKTRNEYRLTRFGRGFDLLNPQSTGNLFILAKKSDEFYKGFMLESDEEIEEFLSAFGMSPSDTNRLINVTSRVTDQEKMIREFDKYVKISGKAFPLTEKISEEARRIVEAVSGKSNSLLSVKSPDSTLISWLDTEYNLFKTIENNYYSSLLDKPFTSVDSFIVTANSMLNRRRSRAGKSLEHHLCNIFTFNSLKYDYQAKTEKNKKPDFIFPGEKYYFQDKYSKNLVFLASKTTCKDRWRQILNEADRIRTKHLFTLQQGISGNQLEEMEDQNVVLVCPSQYRKSFPKQYQSKILTLQEFIGATKVITDVQ